jgi:hypothetical protein
MHKSNLKMFYQEEVQPHEQLPTDLPHQNQRRSCIDNTLTYMTLNQYPETPQ